MQNSMIKTFTCPLCGRKGISIDIHTYPVRLDIIGRCGLCDKTANVSQKRAFDPKKDS